MKGKTFIFLFILSSAVGLFSDPEVNFIKMPDPREEYPVLHSLDVFIPEEDNLPVADVFEVMDEVGRLSSMDLWPGFEILKIPVMIFDGLNTYLFNSTEPYEGFAEVAGKPGVYVHGGQHPSVRGNSVVRIGDIWTATSVLSRSSRRTGDTYSIRDMAGIVIHEQFHIFQRLNHPGWRQNDGLLLIYPPETIQSLFLRRSEKEAFKRAVLSEEINEIVSWAKEGLKYRERRFNLVDSAFVRYEKELQRTEGLSDYIEKVSRGSDPLNASSISNGIAPAGVRDLGYVEGRWISLILDKLKPDWKLSIEDKEYEYLEDVLKSTTDPFEPGGGFTAPDLNEIRARAEDDFEKWQEEKEQQLENFYSEPGFRIEIDASANPLRIALFEPLEIETMENNGVFHKVIFSARNDKGSLRIRQHPCITIFDASFRVVKIITTGLSDPPEVDEKAEIFKIVSNGISVEFKYSKISIDKDKFSVEL